MPKGKAKENETPRERLLRLAPPRVDAALKKISLVGNLARPGYEHEPEEVRQIVSALQQAVDELKQQFNRKPGAKRTGFAFKRSSERPRA